MQMPSENNPLSMEYQTMSNIPAELKYVASHEWLRLEEDGTITRRHYPSRARAVGRHRVC